MSATGVISGGNPKVPRFWLSLSGIKPPPEIVTRKTRPGDGQCRVETAGKLFAKLCLSGAQQSEIFAAGARSSSSEMRSPVCVLAIARLLLKFNRGTIESVIKGRINFRNCIFPSLFETKRLHFFFFSPQKFTQRVPAAKSNYAHCRRRR